MNKNIDIKNIKTAKRYALALSQCAIDNLDEVNENLTLVDEVIFKNPDYMNFFSHPIVSLKDKKGCEFICGLEYSLVSYKVDIDMSSK